jgi:hypothetical protein
LSICKITKILIANIAYTYSGGKSQKFAPAEKPSYTIFVILSKAFILPCKPFSIQRLIQHALQTSHHFLQESLHTLFNYCNKQLATLYILQE